MTEPADIPGVETYEEKRIRLRLRVKETPGPRGSYRSFTAQGGVSVTLIVTWFVGMWWYYSVEVWDLLGLMRARTPESEATDLYITRDYQRPADEPHHWKHSEMFWVCAAAGEACAQALVTRFGGIFPAPLNPFSRCDGAYSNDPRPTKRKS